MKKPNLIDVICPHCQATQSEPAAAISTNCKSCGKYFKLKSAAAARTTRTRKATREVFCIQCGAPNLVPEAAMSTQCSRCLHYLELGDKIVQGVQSGKLYAYDDVIFAEGCSFKGMEATGHNMEIRGKVFSKLKAIEKIVALDGCQVSGELHAPVVRIERGAKVKVQIIECTRLEVSGEVEVTGKLSASEIALGEGAVFSPRLNIPDTKLKIEAGAHVEFDSITCQELTVEDHLKLHERLTAEKVIVLKGGVLIAPVISVAAIEVNPGGSFQGRIEKYVPREIPIETPPQAEAA